MLANIALAYRIVWNIAYYAAKPVGMWGGAALVFFVYGVGTAHPTNALPYVVVWLMLVIATRFLLLHVLPYPNAKARDFMPKQKPMPSAVQAVVVTPDCAEDCPDEQTMIDRLPENMRRLIR